MNAETPKPEWLTSCAICSGEIDPKETFAVMGSYKSPKRMSVAHKRCVEKVGLETLLGGPPGLYVRAHYHMPLDMVRTRDGMLEMIRKVFPITSGEDEV
jgi:hypothetical protein